MTNSLPLARLGKQVAGWGRAVSGLFRTRFTDLRCTSLSGGKPLSLPGMVLRAADEARVTFTVNFSVTSFRSARDVTVWHASAPRTKSWGRPKGAGCGWGAGDERLALQQTCQWRKCRITLALPRQLLLDQQSCELEIRVGGRPWRAVQVRIIDQIQAQQLRLQELRVQEQGLWIRSGEHQYRSDVILERGALLLPEFTLVGSDLHTALPPSETHLKLSWEGENQTRTFLSETPMVLRPGPMHVKPGPVTDCLALSRPGNYRLVASIDGQVISTLPFQVVGREQWLNQLSVTILVEGETSEGGLRRESGALRWDRHIGFCAVLRIRTGIPAPNTAITGITQIVLEHRVIQRQEINFQLVRSCQEVRLRKFCLAELEPGLRGRRAELYVTLDVEGVPKATRPVVILPAGRWTNFEGQLAQDIQRLEVTTDDYERIVQRLKPNSAHSGPP